MAESPGSQPRRSDGGITLARVELITEQQATGRVKEIYEDIKTSMGWDMVPQTFQLIAHNPGPSGIVLGLIQADDGPGKA